MLYYVVVCYKMLWCVIGPVMLWCVIYVMVCFTMLWYVVLYYVIMCYIMLLCNVILEDSSELFMRVVSDRHTTVHTTPSKPYIVYREVTRDLGRRSYFYMRSGGVATVSRSDVTSFHLVLLSLTFYAGTLYSDCTEPV